MRRCTIQATGNPMDKTNQWNAISRPSADSEDEALAKRLTDSWARSAPQRTRGRSGEQVMQRLRDGRVRVVPVESARSRRRPALSEG